METAGIALLCTALGAAAGCDLLPDRAFAALDGALTLSVVRVTPVGTRETRFDLELKNGGRTRAHACLGPERTIYGASGMGIVMVSHPGCVRDFALDPGGVLEWSDTHEVTTSPERPNDVSVTIQILNPRRCRTSVGCAGFHVESARRLPLP